MIFDNPKVILIFCSDGASAIEKGLMILICKIFNCKSLIFPRAGKLINQVSKFYLFNKFIKYSFNKADIFLCQGPKWKQFALNTLDIKNYKVKLVTNWTATKTKIKIGKARNYKNKKVIKIVFVGWLEKFKGLEELLLASKSLLNRGYDFKLDIVGRGNYENYSKHFVKKNNLESNISFLGWKNSKNLDNILQLNDVFVLPSWDEGMPNSMIEAMAAGLGVIVSSVGVIPDYIVDEYNGLLIKPKDPVSLENAIIKIINNFELRKNISINGHQLAVDKL